MNNDNTKKLICAEDFFKTIEYETADVCETVGEFETEWGFSRDALKEILDNTPSIPVISLEEHLKMQREWAEKYAELRESFIDYVCSGSSNLAPYCANKSGFCTNARGWCIEGCGSCKGFIPK